MTLDTTPVHIALIVYSSYCSSRLYVRGEEFKSDLRR